MTGHDCVRLDGAREVLQSQTARGRFIVSVASAYALLASAWMLFADRTLASFGDLTTITGLANAKGWAFVSVTTGLFVLALRAVPPATAKHFVTRSAWPMLGIGLALAVMIAAATAVAAQVALTRIEREAGDRLCAIARLNADRLSQWMADHRAVAERLASSPIIAERLRSWQSHHRPEDLAIIKETLERWSGLNGVRALQVYGLSAELLLNEGESVIRSGWSRDGARRAIATGETTLVDFNRDTAGQVVFGLATPLVIKTPDGSDIMGALIFSLDPSVFIYPALQKWPLPSHSGESLLWRRDGEKRTLLSQPRKADPDLFGVNMPLAADQLVGLIPTPGDHTARKALDYRGIPVLGAAATVPGTPWIVIAKEDEVEALGPGRRFVFAGVGVVGALTLAGLAGAGLLIQRRRLLGAMVEVARGRALIETESRFRASFEHSAFGMGHLTPDGVYLRANRRLGEFLGVPHAAFNGRRATEHMPDGERDAYVDGLARLHSGAINDFSLERHILRPDGTEIDILVTSSLAPAQEAQPAYIVSVVQDISARLAAEAEVERSKRDLRRMFEVTPMAIVILEGEDRRIHRANPAACAMLEYAHDDLIGMPVAHFLSSDSSPGQLPPFLAAHDAADTIEARMATRSGAIIQVRCARARFDRPGDATPMTIVLAENITELRTTEEALRQAQKMEAVGTLTGGLAHDFNNLLAVIIGNLDLVEPLLDKNSKAQDFVTSAIESALRGAELTQSLLAFSRRQTLRPIRVQINDLVAGMHRMLGRLLGRHIEITLHLSDNVWPVVADPSQIEASIANLATNARDAMPKGGQLTIATGNQYLDADYAALHPTVTPGDYAVIVVSDNGCGMTNDVMERMFEPFFTTKEPGQGTGLGLSMVFGFARQSLGHVTAYSDPGVGTTFRLFLPRDTNEVESAMQSVASHSLPTPSGKTILVVEDNVALRVVVMRQLGELGYRVIESESPLQALEIVRTEQIDLIFTDVIMPGGISGIDLAEQARVVVPGIKVLLTSGFLGAQVAGLNDQAGQFPLLGKPYRRNELAGAVLAAMANAQINFA